MQFGVRARTSRKLPMSWPTQKDMSVGVAIHQSATAGITKMLIVINIPIVTAAAVFDRQTSSPGTPPLSNSILIHDVDQGGEYAPVPCLIEYL